MKIVNWRTEEAIARMRHHRWTERSRQQIPSEGRVLVRLSHPRQGIGDGADRPTAKVKKSSSARSG